MRDQTRVQFGLKAAGHYIPTEILQGSFRGVSFCTPVAKHLAVTNVREAVSLLKVVANRSLACANLACHSDDQSRTRSRHFSERALYQLAASIGSRPVARRMSPSFA